MASFVRYMDESILPKRLWLIRQTRDTFRGNATLSSDPKSCKQMKSAACCENEATKRRALREFEAAIEELPLFVWWLV
ncbi:hypothetical protein Cob_v003276 [Colletotrichum orbiculare MAFF 240422]|uniref:Uncharacterized protein n=1 Tax=Colletotrichum orbiculare (strain 104-T / ATCC 96160 / CBS 514.97 / LARS 414 / MAFF 240422) TaxID=1213857 RepID=A0A484G131_COLOR|nr:hypothetical protein Cob_v003276 [Colletotrichum orbiculare MAFF 240422]